MKYLWKGLKTSFYWRSLTNLTEFELFGKKSNEQKMLLVGQQLQQKMVLWTIGSGGTKTKNRLRFVKILENHASLFCHFMYLFCWNVKWSGDKILTFVTKPQKHEQGLFVIWHLCYFCICFFRVRFFKQHLLAVTIALSSLTPPRSFSLFLSLVFSHVGSSSNDLSASSHHVSVRSSLTVVLVP